RGWLALDKAVNPFLTQVYQKPNYRINDRFLSQDWADYTGDNQQFQ
ncbi:D-alanyl-lipoteichoic acid biosynthesis protein DltD, partial [Streptococcus pyogenes]